MLILRFGCKVRTLSWNDEKKKDNEHQIQNSIEFAFIDYLPNCNFSILFLDLGRELFVSLARCTHRSLLQVPAYLAHASAVSHTSHQPGS